MAFSILVTGGAGYLGSVLVPELLSKGHRVCVLDNFLFGQNSLAQVCADPNFSVVNGDVRIESIVRPLVAKSDIVIPLAARVGAPMCDNDPVAAETTNLEAQLMLLGMLGADQRILVPTTNSGYGVGSGNAYCTEESPLRPVSSYSKQKVAAEAAALDRGDAISFRLATVFGMSPRMRVDLLVNDFVYRAVNDQAIVLFESQFRRNYIHIRDVARAFIHGIENFGTMKNEAYNVGLSDANLSKWDLCERIKQHIPEFVFFDAPIGEDPDKRDYIVSNEKVESTGFAPRYSLDDGIKELIKAYTMIRNRQYGNA